MSSVTLFSPIAIGGVTLRNRLAVAPMTRVSAGSDGCVTDRMVAYYEEFARGGWGLVETEGTYIDDEYSQGRAHQPGIATTAQRDAWRRVVDAVHGRGAAVFIQLQHAGALAEYGHTRTETVGPSPVLPRGKKPLAVPRELTVPDIARIQEHFARAARRAVEAGFDGVELHGHNGYLIDQFLTGCTNLRSDQYGGSITNRIRFAVETVDAVRRAVPAAYPVGVRLNHAKSHDPTYVWPGGEDDAATIVRSLIAAGATFLHISALHDPQAGRANRQLLDVARSAGQVMLIANGGLDDPARAHALVNEGHTDLVALARGALANPDWPSRVLTNSPLATYDPAMIKPTPTLENADAWRRQRLDWESCRLFSS
jgi:2,4-dienoyl-CoA reductase-like NADH-dependent reductase (Old Yellow Enzyme family)